MSEFSGSTARAWLQSQDPAHFTLQLLADQDHTAVQRFAERQVFTSPVETISYVRNGALWYALIHGSYPTHAAAALARRELIEANPRLDPWIRTISGVQADIR